MRRPSLSRRLRLEEKLRAADGAGGFSTQWQELGTRWAEVTPLTGRMTDGETGAVSVTAFRITLRAAPQGHSNRPGAGQRLRLGTRIFRIEAVTEMDARGLYLECRCEEEIAT